MIRCGVYLDKAAKQLVVKIVYVGDGQQVLDVVSSVAAKSQTASAVVSRLGDSVRTFTQQMPGLQVRGFALRLEIVGASLAALRTAVAASEVAEMEKTIIKADALIFVIDANAPDANATFDRVRREFHVLASSGAQSPVAVIGAGTDDDKAAVGGTETPMYSGANAGVLALQAVTKQILAHVLSGLGN